LVHKVGAVLTFMSRCGLPTKFLVTARDVQVKEEEEEEEG
jgi:hypothetical protein